MGNTLQRAAEWTSAQGSTRLKLEYTLKNEKILNEILGFVEAFPGQQPAAAELQFRTALSWDSHLKAADFSAPDYAVR